MLTECTGPSAIEVGVKILICVIVIVGIVLVVEGMKSKRKHGIIFCEKCGAQLPDTASFCNKCGNTLRKGINTVQKQVRKNPTMTGNQKNFSSVSNKGRNAIPKILIGIVLLVVLIVVMAAIFTGIKKNSIYGTWTDANKTITFTFNKDGNLRVSGANNILGADAFQFTEEDGVLRLQAQGLAGIGVDLEYEIVDNVLNISIMGQSMTLYRAEDSEAENVEDALGDWVENALDTVQIYTLYGTWTDSYGAISFTFSEDGKLSVSGLEDTLAVDAFIFSEVDDDTLQLKADSKNPIVGAVGLNMDYEIEGDSMTVTIAGKELKLIKKN